MKKDGISVFRELALFQDYHGLPALKNVRRKREWGDQIFFPLILRYIF